MRKLSVVAILLICSISVIAQKKTEATFKPETIELLTPWKFDGGKAKPSEEQRLRSCFNFILMDYGCGSAPLVAYGDRVGINWDLFHISGGKADRTRMIEIGKFGWSDKFTVPYVEPWAALSPGERRNITINASGGSGTQGPRGRDGADGVAGMNGDGTYTPIPRTRKNETMSQPILTAGKSYATANIKEQVSSTVKDWNGRVRNDAYSPMVEVRKGYMYVVRVVDESRDFYVIIHVDDLVRGESVKLSYWKFEQFAL
jgi:hypothetical protein